MEDVLFIVFLSALVVLIGLAGIRLARGVKGRGIPTPRDVPGVDKR